MSNELAIREAITELEKARAEEVTGADLIETASVHVIFDEASYNAAEDLRQQAKDFQKAVHARLDPVCEATNAAHKASTKTRKEFLEPYEKAEKLIASKQVQYRQEQERKRRAEEERLRREAEERAREEARKRQEELERQAAEAAESGNDADAEALLEKAIEAESEPIVPVHFAVKSSENLAGAYVPTYDVECVSLKTMVDAIAAGKVPLDFVRFNDVEARKHAKSLKEGFNSAYERYGVRAFDKGSLR